MSCIAGVDISGSSKEPFINGSSGFYASDPGISEVKSTDQLTFNGVLGEGAFGVVSLVTFKGKKYAQKTIEKAKIIKMLQGDEQAYINIRNREISMSEAVFHIMHCTKFYTHFEEGGKDIFIYEFCEGGDLTGLRKKQPNGRFTEVTARKFLHQIALAMSELHIMKIVHRDIKPDNAFISINKKGEYEVKLGDWGTARLIGENK